MNDGPVEISTWPSDPSAPKKPKGSYSRECFVWKVSCGPPQEMTGTGEMTFANDSYTGTMKMTSTQGELTMKMSGKRLGDCTP